MFCSVFAVKSGKGYVFVGPGLILVAKAGFLSNKEWFATLYASTAESFAIRFKFQAMLISVHSP